MEIAYSLNGVPIRFTEERWEHILSNKPYMASHYAKIITAVENPTLILRGYAGALVAILSIARRQYLHVVYKEISYDDGFVITAFVAKKYNRRVVIWP